MATFDPKNTMDNFDKEFSLKKKTTTRTRGKLPSWILIAAGAAAMGGVVIARQPAGTNTDNNIRAAAVTPTAIVETVDQAPFNGNDVQADPMELASYFGSVDELQGTQVFYTPDEQPFSMQLEPLTTDSNGYIVPPSSTGSDSVIYWVDEKPYSLTVEEIQQTQKAASAQDGPTVYWLGGLAYNVQLEPVSDADISSAAVDVSNLVRIGDQDYQLLMTPVNGTAVAQPTVQSPTQIPVTVAADADPFKDEPSASVEENINTAVEDRPAVAWLDDQAYLVSVKPASEVDSVDEADQPDQTIPFDVDGKAYELELTETKIPAAAVDKKTDPIVWADELPLQVSLQNGIAGTMNVMLNPVPDEEQLALQKARFGADYEPNRDENGAAEPTAEPTEEPVQPTEEGSWFSDLFTNIFGSSPTATPTPQITVIAPEPTATVIRPTATPIIVRVAPTAVPQQEPVRLDDESGTTGKDVDAALIADDEDDLTPVPTKIPVQVVTQAPVRTVVAVVVEPTEETQTAETAADNGEEAASSEITIANAGPQQPAVSPTPQELPHTGGVEGWNIPQMLIMLAGLLLIIIGVRRLRTGRE